MTHISKDRTTQREAADGFEGRYEDLGGYVVGWETYTADQDMAPLFKGLPDDACQARHWGFVLVGKVGFRYTDGIEETVEAGSAYYARPGHTPLFYDGTQIVEFSPADELATTIEVVTKNIATMEAGALS